MTKIVVHLANFNKSVEVSGFLFNLFFQENGRNILIFFASNLLSLFLIAILKKIFKRLGSEKKYIKPIAFEKTVEIEKIGLKET